MTPRTVLLICALGCLAWLGVLFVALCAAKGLMPTCSPRLLVSSRIGG